VADGSSAYAAPPLDDGSGARVAQHVGFQTLIRSSLTDAGSLTRIATPTRVARFEVGRFPGQCSAPFAHRCSRKFALPIRISHFQSGDRKGIKLSPIVCKPFAPYDRVTQAVGDTVTVIAGPPDFS
jgi:hypothetical protein